MVFASFFSFPPINYDSVPDTDTLTGLLWAYNLFFQRFNATTITIEQRFSTFSW